MSLFRQTLQHVEESASVRLRRKAASSRDRRRFGEEGCEGVAMEATHASAVRTAKTSADRGECSRLAHGVRGRPVVAGCGLSCLWASGLGDPIFLTATVVGRGVPGAARLAIDPRGKPTSMS